MRPEKLKTRIFLDGGNPDETKEIMNRMGFLDGHTTNPMLISKNPKAEERMDRGDRHDLTEKGMDQFSRDWNSLVR
jgi:transaldolase